MLQLQQLDRRKYVTDQDAPAVPRAEDHQGADAHSQIELCHDLAKCGLRCNRDGIGSVQSDVGHVMTVWLRPLLPGQTGCSEPIPLGNHRRLG